MKYDIDPSEPSVRFLFLGLVFVLFSWAAYGLASAGVFGHGTVTILAVISAASIAIALFRWLSVESITARILFTLTIAYSTFLLFSAMPTIFSGRDQGSIAEAAIELSQNGKIPVTSSASDTFFAMYGPGKALNFPGFFYASDGSLRSQFPISYTAWLGVFHSLFGLSGLLVGNGVLLVLSLLTLFILVRLLADETAASGAVLVAATSFPLSWFAKFTLTENLALFLFLLLSLSTVLFLKNRRRLHFLVAILTAILLAVTRIEGLFILATTAGILCFSKHGKRFISSQPVILRIGLVAGTVAILLFDVLDNIPHYASIAKALLQSSSSVAEASVGVAKQFQTAFQLWKLFLPYGLFPLFLVGGASIVVLLIRKNRLALIPVLLALPTFLYLIAPNISADHPWMFRRLLFSVWPAFLIPLAVVLPTIAVGKRPAEKRITIMLFALIALAGLFPTISSFTFSENGRLPEETAALAGLIGTNDLLLIDRGSTGDPYAIPAGPLRFLYGKNAAYFFNPDDFTKIQKDRYEHIYLLTPIDALDRWNTMPATFNLVTVIPFHAERLGPLPIGDSRFPGKTATTTDSLLFSLDPL